MKSTKQKTKTTSTITNVEFNNCSNNLLYKSLYMHGQHEHDTVPQKAKNTE